MRYSGKFVAVSGFAPDVIIYEINSNAGSYTGVCGVVQYVKG